MLPTRTTVWLLVLGFFLWLAGLAVPLLAGVLPETVTANAGPASRWLVLGFDSAVVLLSLAAGILAARSTRPNRLTVRRDRPARLSLGVENEVTLVLDNHGRRGLRLRVRDEPPPGFPAEPAVLEADVPAHGCFRLAYRVRPTARGNFAFGGPPARCRGPLGLAWADRPFPLGESVQVYPNLLEIRRYEALVRTTLVRAG